MVNGESSPSGVLSMIENFNFGNLGGFIGSLFGGGNKAVPVAAPIGNQQGQAKPGRGPRHTQ